MAWRLTWRNLGEEAVSSGATVTLRVSDGPRSWMRRGVAATARAGTHTMARLTRAMPRGGCPDQLAGRRRVVAGSRSPEGCRPTRASPSRLSGGRSRRTQAIRRGARQGLIILVDGAGVDVGAGLRGPPVTWTGGSARGRGWAASVPHPHPPVQGSRPACVAGCWLSGCGGCGGTRRPCRDGVRCVRPFRTWTLQMRVIVNALAPPWRARKANAWFPLRGKGVCIGWSGWRDSNSRPLAPCTVRRHRAALTPTTEG